MKKRFLALCVVSVLLVCTGCIPSNENDVFRNGYQFKLSIDTNSEKPTEEQFDLAMKVMSKRLNEFGVNKNHISSDNSKYIVVKTPEIRQLNRVKRFISKQGMIEFRIVEDGECESNASCEKLKIHASEEELYVNSTVLLNNQDIKKVIYRISAGTDEPYVLLKLNNNGASKFAQITESNINRRLAIIIDHIIYTTPVIREKIIGDSAMVSGALTIEESVDLSIMLNYGSIPFALELIEEVKL